MLGRGGLMICFEFVGLGRRAIVRMVGVLER